MMYIHRNNEIYKKINVSKIANNVSTMGDNSTAAGCICRLITVLVHVNGCYLRTCCEQVLLLPASVYLRVRLHKISKTTDQE